MNEGLSTAEAERRRRADGPNELSGRDGPGLFFQTLRRLASPLVVILLLAATASALLHDIANSAIIVSIVALSSVIETVQSHRSARAAASLRASVAQTATVLRDGSWQELPRGELVVGDRVRIQAGDMVPADAALLVAKDLHVSEAALTGESLPVEKTAGDSGDAGAVQMGSSVVSGSATATITATGMRTAFGSIAKALSEKPPQSELDRGLGRFGVLILKTVVFLVLFVLVVAAYHRRDPLQTLLFAVALAVGLTPEFLPMITTVTLTRGAIRMAASKVIVKDLAAIHALGSIDILCCDKTGTLTTGVMTLERHVDGLGTTSDRPLMLGCLNSCFESGINNPLDAAVLRKGRIDPLDAAVLDHPHPDISGFRKLDEIPFDFERRRVSVVARRERGAEPPEILLVTKGAPEHVLAIATRIEIDGVVRDLDEATRSVCERTFAELGAAGYRVLGVASAAAEARSAYAKADEHDLVFAGFLAFVDPPRPDAGSTLTALREEGVEVKILTGDNELVAAHLCAAIGLDGASLLTGKELASMTDAALGQRAERTSIFARVSPADKNRILAALRLRGHVVGFIGDGINDAPALHSADVGISVASAVDVAKEAAQVILLEPGLTVLRAGVLEGRRAFGNVLKYVLMGTSSNFGNVFSMAIASVALPFLPMLPTQILLNNFLYDLAQITIPSDNVDPALIHSPQRWNIDLVRRFMIWIGPISSLYDILTFIVLLRVFHAPEAVFHTGWFVESLATQTLVIFVIRSASSPLRSRPSNALVATTIGVVAIAIGLPFTSLGRWFGLVPLPGLYFVFLALATATYLVLVEIAKRRILAPSALGPR